MALTATNPDGSERNQLDQLPRVASLCGWPTTSTMDSGNTGTAWETRRERVKATYPVGHNGFGLILPMAAQLAGWPTPMAGSPGTDSYSQAGNTDSSRRTVALAGGQIAGHGLDLPAEWSGPARLTATGETLIGSDAGTKSGGQLNPEHSLWLMLGPFATAWAFCGERVTRSRSGRRKASSAPLSKV